MNVDFILQHQQQVAAAVERAKQVTMTELNQIIGVGEAWTKTSLLIVLLYGEIQQILMVMLETKLV